MSVIGQLSNFLKPERAIDGPEFRRRVEWLMLLRLIVTSLLLGITIFLQLRASQELAAEATLPLYILIGATFLLSIIYSVYLVVVPELWVLSFVQVMVDLVYGTVLVYFTGGAISVFSVLYIFPILTSGILHLRRGAVFTATVASILFGLLINLEFYGFIRPSGWPWVVAWSRTTSFYAPWVLIVNITTFYLVAVLSGAFAEQLQKTRVSLSLKERDFANLSDLYTSIVRSIPSGIITADRNGLITFVNTAGAEVLGETALSLVGSPLAKVFPALYEGDSGRGRARERFLTVKDVANEKVHLEMMVSDLEGSGNESGGSLVVFQDVTQLRRMEERVKFNEKQAAFVRIAAGMAHEIRNPLASLRGASELLVRDVSSEEMEKRLLSIVIRESDRLNSLLGDFLAVVGVRKSEKLRVMLTDLVEETLDLFAKQPRVGREVALETLVNRGVEVEGAPARLRQACWNLLVNALDATNGQGTIRVVLESDPAAGQAVLKVQDSGQGIPPELRDRIFEAFTTTKEKGAGLGLALVLSIIQDHDGTVEVDSNPGLGSLFTVRLPLAPPEREPQQEGWTNG